MTLTLRSDLFSNSIEANQYQLTSSQLSCSQMIQSFKSEASSPVALLSLVAGGAIARAVEITCFRSFSALSHFSSSRVSRLAPHLASLAGIITEGGAFSLFPTVQEGGSLSTLAIGTGHGSLVIGLSRLIGKYTHSNFLVSCIAQDGIVIGIDLTFEKLELREKQNTQITERWLHARAVALQMQVSTQLCHQIRFVSAHQAVFSLQKEIYNSSFSHRDSHSRWSSPFSSRKQLITREGVILSEHELFLEKERKTKPATPLLIFHEQDEISMGTVKGENQPKMTDENSASPPPPPSSEAGGSKGPTGPQEATESHPPPQNPLRRSKTVPLVPLSQTGQDNIMSCSDLSATVTVTIQPTSKERNFDLNQIPHKVSREVTIIFGEKMISFYLSGRCEAKPLRWIFNFKDILLHEKGANRTIYHETFPVEKSKQKETVEFNLGGEIIRVSYHLLYQLGQYKPRYGEITAPVNTHDKIEQMTVPLSLDQQKMFFSEALRRAYILSSISPAIFLRMPQDRLNEDLKKMGTRMIERYGFSQVIGDPIPTTSTATILIPLLNGGCTTMTQEHQVKVPLANGNCIVFETYGIKDIFHDQYFYFRAIGYHNKNTNLTTYHHLLEGFSYEPRKGSFGYTPHPLNYDPMTDGVSMIVPMGNKEGIQMILRLATLSAFNEIATRQLASEKPEEVLLSTTTHSQIPIITEPIKTEEAETLPISAPEVFKEASPSIKTIDETTKQEAIADLGGGGLLREAGDRRYIAPQTAPSAIARSIRDEIIARTHLHPSLLSWRAGQNMPDGFKMEGGLLKDTLGINKAYRFFLPIYVSSAFSKHERSSVEGSLFLTTETDPNGSFKPMARLGYKNPSTQDFISVVIHPITLPGRNGEAIFKGTGRLGGLLIHVSKTGEATLLTPSSFERALSWSLGIPSATEHLSSEKFNRSVSPDIILQQLYRNGLKEKIFPLVKKNREFTQINELLEMAESEIEKNFSELSHYKNVILNVIAQSYAADPLQKIKEVIEKEYPKIAQDKAFMNLLKKFSQPIDEMIEEAKKSKG